MTKKEVENWCAVNGYQLQKRYVDVKKHIPFLDLEIMIEAICGIKSIYNNGRKEREVFARWLASDYIRRTTKLSYQYIANRYGVKQHGTIMHGIKELQNEFLDGWRLEMYKEFQDQVNEKHEELNFNKVYE